jgi:alkylhydroperoxidase/carboxymuconolactone decarboxylase family protein YurZ
MAGDPLEVYKELDPELLKLVRQSSELAMAEGALPRKIKFLIAMALDAAHGAADGVTSLAGAAMQAGATKQEIAEALRVAHYVSGAGSTYTAARGLKDIV